jgi:putative ABC transport system permease protein
MAYLSLFIRLMVRPLLRERTRSLLVVFAVALGVSVVLAIDIAGTAAAGSFRSSIETLAGKSNFEITTTGGVAEGLVGELARLPYPIRVSPRIENHATVVSTGETIPLIGLDLVAEASNTQEPIIATPDDGQEFEHVNDPAAIWTTRELGERLGARISLQVNDHQREYVVRGFIPESARIGGNAVVMDIAAAQSATGSAGRVDRILVTVPKQPGFEYWREKLRGVLPPGVSLNAQGSQSAANQRMLAAFRWNLRILSYVALVVGAFLIYNTISVSVVRRRADIGIIRALGASRRAVLTGFLAEAALFGVAGAILALPLGRLMATGTVRLLGSTVNALYVSSSPGPLNLSAGSVLLALVVGMSVAVASALGPALEASRVSPTEAMARARREYEVRVSRKREAVIALLLAVGGGVAARVPAVYGKPLFGYLSTLLLIAASALVTPLLVCWLTSLSSTILGRLLGVEAMLASRSLAGSVRRTSVLVGALSTAIAMMTSVGIMVGSFRQTVVTWMDTQLPADLYLRPAGDPSADRHPTISPEVTERIGKLPSVESVSRFRAYEIQYEGMPVTLASAETDTGRVESSAGFLSGRPESEVLKELSAKDAAIVSEPFANKHHVRAGDRLTLPLAQKLITFRVVDVFYDYANERGYVILDRPTMLTYLPDPAASNLAVYLRPEVDPEQGRNEVRKAVANHEVLIFSNREIRQEAIRIFDQTFAITYALEAIAVVVAVMGIAGAFISIVIDRRREFGVLRFLGGATSQIRRLILVEAGLIGILANITGLVLGVLLSLVLIFVINKQSFGWTIQFHWPVAVLVGGVTVVYAATLLAGVYPSRIAQRLNPIEVVHEE